ncbi:MAG: peptidylprolyl isomerase [Desulfobacterales bacterium]
MEKVANEAYVSVEYTGTLENGEVFDSSSGRPPLEVKMGAGQVIKGFEEALMGMTINEKKKITIEPEDAYGQRDDSLLHDFPRSNVPPEVDPKKGQIVGLQTPDGQQVPAQVISVDEEKVILDLNHPLAGQALTFDIEVVGISETPTQQSGCAGCSEGGCEPGCC